MQTQPSWLKGYFRRKGQMLAVMCAVLVCWAAAALPGDTTAVSGETARLAGLTVLVDAGHGGYDGGARGASGVWEKEINLRMARHVEEALTAMGARVVMTRTEDVDLTSEPRPADLTKKRQDMIARVEIAKANEVDLVLSIHMNYYRDKSQSGPQVFYRAGCDGGRLLAGCMQESLIERLQPKKRRNALAGDYFILQLDVPSVLIECGFLSNAREEKLLLDEAYQQRIAQAVTEGVCMYLSLR